MSNSRNSTAPTVPNQDAVNKRYTKAKNDSGVITEEEPDKHKAPRLVGAAATTDAFPDLKEKRVAKIDPEHVPTVIVPLSGQAIIVGSSVGDSGANISIAPIDVVINDCAAFGSNSHSRPADIHVAVFLELIAKLAKLDTIRSVDIVPLHPRQRRDYLSPMPNIVDEDGVIHPSCFVNRANGKSEKTRRRKISIARMRDGDVTQFLLIPEPCHATPVSIDMHLLTDQLSAIHTIVEVQKVISQQFSRCPGPGRRLELTESISSMHWSAQADDSVASVESVANYFLTQYEQTRHPELWHTENMLHD